MDLKDLKPKSDTIEILLLHPVTGEHFCHDDGKEMSITVYAPYSKEYKAVEHEIQNKKISKMQKLGKKALFTAEELEGDSLDLLARTTKSWDITYEGKKPKFSVDLAKEIYSEYYWIRQQVEEGVLEHMGFTRI